MVAAERVIAEYSQDAFQQRTPLERNLALINADLMALLAHVNEPLERALAQTSDPIDRLKLLQTMLPEQCKLTREIRALSEMQTRTERQRYEEELAWLRNQQRRTSSGDGVNKKPR